MSYEDAMDYLKDQADRLEEKPVNIPEKYVRDLVEAANNVVFEYVNSENERIGGKVTTRIDADKLEYLKRACEALPL